ncbi:MAG: LytR/AlgR family response regulator transcription factor [Desulfitobacteriaceae bacterium]
MRVVIVDDESPARDELKYLLEKMPNVEIAGLARNGQEALAIIPELSPDVVFLDIQMPDLSGLSVARELYQRLGPEDFPFLVFATAYDQHALEAFEVNAIDYVLKPFSEERLQQTVQRLKRSLQGGPCPPETVKSGRLGGEKLDRILSLLERPSARTKLPVEENERIILLNAEEIVFAGVEGRQVHVKTKDASYATSYSLSELEARLGLMQTHKSYVVNKEMVREIVPWFNGTYNLIMNDREKSQVPVSRTFVKSVKQALEL